MNGSLEGQGRFEYIDGSVYEGMWKNNKKQGKGKFQESDGMSIYNGEWENDMKHGQGIFVQKDACIIEGVWS